VRRRGWRQRRRERWWSRGGASHTCNTQTGYGFTARVPTCRSCSRRRGAAAGASRVLREAQVEAVRSSKHSNAASASAERAAALMTTWEDEDSRRRWDRRGGQASRLVCARTEWARPRRLRARVRLRVRCLVTVVSRCPLDRLARRASQHLSLNSLGFRA